VALGLRSLRLSSCDLFPRIITHESGHRSASAVIHLSPVRVWQAMQGKAMQRTSQHELEAARSGVLDPGGAMTRRDKFA
jgi:hypothetical protein